MKLDVITTYTIFSSSTDYADDMGYPNVYWYFHKAWLLAM